MRLSFSFLIAPLLNHVFSLQALSLSIRNSQLPNKREKLEYIFDKFDPSDRYVEVGGMIIESLINEYCTMGAYDDAKRVFDMIQGPCNGQCLRAILFACAKALPAPRWEEVGRVFDRSSVAFIFSSSLNGSLLRLDLNL